MRRSAYDRKQGWYRGKQSLFAPFGYRMKCLAECGWEGFLFASAGAAFYELDFRRNIEKEELKMGTNVQADSLSAECTKTMNGALMLIESLKKENVEMIFGYPGSRPSDLR